MKGFNKYLCSYAALALLAALHVSVGCAKFKDSGAPSAVMVPTYSQKDVTADQSAVDRAQKSFNQIKEDPQITNDARLPKMIDAYNGFNKAVTTVISKYGRQFFTKEDPNKVSSLTPGYAAVQENTKKKMEADIAALKIKLHLPTGALSANTASSGTIAAGSDPALATNVRSFFYSGDLHGTANGIGLGAEIKNSRVEQKSADDLVTRAQKVLDNEASFAIFKTWLNRESEDNMALANRDANSKLNLTSANSVLASRLLDNMAAFKNSRGKTFDGVTVDEFDRWNTTFP